MSVTCPMAAASVVTHRKDNSPEIRMYVFRILVKIFGKTFAYGTVVV